MKKTQTQSTLSAEKTGNGLELYLEMNGAEYYLVTHRPDEALWAKLKEGVTVGELRRISTARSSDECELYQASQYLVKIIDDFLEYEAAA